MLAEIVLLLGSYLFGSLPFAVALSRNRGLKPSEEEDLHIALWNKVGKKQASLAGFIDFLKGILPVLVAYGLNMSPAVITFCGVAAVAGQMWPPIRRSHGERGNTTGGGAAITLILVFTAYPMLFALIPPIIVAILALFVESGESRAMPIGNLIAFAMLPTISWFIGQPHGLTLGLLTLLIILIVRRLTAGLKADLGKGYSTTKILLDRFIFDQLLERCSFSLILYYLES